MSEVKINGIRIKNIYYMLAYAYKSLNLKKHQNIEPEKFDNVHNLLAFMLIGLIGEQIKRGLYKDYQETKDSLSSLRGKIEFADSFKENSQLYKKMFCQVDFFSENNFFNQILKATIGVLLKYADLSLENKNNLKKIYQYLGQIKELNPKSLKRNRLQYFRNNSNYKYLLNLCFLILDDLLLSTEKGKYSLASFFSEQKIYFLYEKFVRNYYKREFPQYSPKASFIEWDSDNLEFLPKMRSDIILSYKDKSLIIDTKYYKEVMKNNTLNSNNIYQIRTYVEDKDKKGTGKVSGVLLYAKTVEEQFCDYDFIMGKNKNQIGVIALDLGEKWVEIKKKLDFLPEKYLKG